MSTRISSLALLTAAVLLAGCGETSGEPEGPKIACAIGPGAQLSDVCTLERVSPEAFAIHWPDGGFRRFTLEQGAQGPIPAFADGADELTIVRSEGEQQLLEFGVADERYRLEPGLLAAESDE